MHLTFHLTFILILCYNFLIGNLPNFYIIGILILFLTRFYNRKEQSMTNTWLNSKEEDLVLNNLGLVRLVVNKLSISPNDYEDMKSIGTIGLIKAAKTFDSSKKLAFSTYAVPCIRNEILMYLRKENKRVYDVSLNQILTIDTIGNELTLNDTICDTKQHFTEEFEEKELLTKCMSIILNVLEPKERLIMLYTISGFSQKFIGNILNISQSFISRKQIKIKKKILSILSSSFEFEELFSFEIVDNFYQICNGNEKIICVPAYPESFYNIALFF